MALNWDLSKCEGGGAALWSDEHADATRAVIMSTMGVGIGRITPANVEEFAARLHILERLHDALLHRAGKDGRPEAVPFGLAELRRYVGLSTNVGNEPRGKWMARVIGSEMERHIHEQRRKVAEANG